MHLRLLGLASLLLVQSAHAQSFDWRYARAPDEAAICEDARLSVWASPCGVEGSVRNLSTPGGWNGTETSPEAVHPRV